MHMVPRALARHHDLAPGHEHLDPRAVQPPLVVMVVRRLHGDMAAQDIALEALQPRRLLADARLQRRRRRHVLEGDLQRNGHAAPLILWSVVSAGPGRPLADTSAAVACYLDRCQTARRWQGVPATAPFARAGSVPGVAGTTAGQGQPCPD